MRLARHTTWIVLSPDQVFDFFMDFAQAPRWRSYVRSMTPVDDAPVRVGSKVHVEMDLLGKPYTFDLEVLALDPPRLWRHRTDEADFDGHIEYRFEPDGIGTRVTMTLEARPRGLYGWLAVPLLLLRRNRAYADQLPRLKRALEERATSSV